MKPFALTCILLIVSASVSAQIARTSRGDPALNAGIGITEPFRPQRWLLLGELAGQARPDVRIA